MIIRGGGGREGGIISNSSELLVNIKIKISWFHWVNVNKLIGNVH